MLEGILVVTLKFVHRSSYRTVVLLPLPDLVNLPVCYLRNHDVCYCGCRTEGGTEGGLGVLVLHNETVDGMTGGYERGRAKVVTGAGVIESKGYNRY
jgi:hypothetical protein